MATTCDSCGAAVPDGARTCDLCGTPVGGAPAPDGGAGLEAAGYCSQCGNALAPGARFCSQCGALVAEPAAAPPPAPPAEPGRPSSAAGRQGLVVAGVGLAVVLGLYAMTLLSRDAPDQAPGPDAAQVGEAAPIPDGAPPLPDTLQAAADRFAALGTAEGWYESGRYYLTAAFGTVQSDPTSSVRWARRAVADFERSLEIEEAPRVRVALAEAATFDPSDPMRPVQELQAVLEADPTNVDATFLLGERRLMIGRVDSARAAFERVLELAPADAPIRGRAQEALAALDASP